VQKLGGSTARQIARMANGNIAYHRDHAHFHERGFARGRRLWVLLSP